MAKGKENRPHIGIFGRRNNGKSSLINALAGQELAIVSDVPGTTTDPVKKTMEIGGIGPVVLIDTAGIDDEGELGQKRIEKSLATLKTIDLAILVITHNQLQAEEEKLISEFKRWELPFIVIHNKSDISRLDTAIEKKAIEHGALAVLDFSARFPDNLESHYPNHT